MPTKPNATQYSSPAPRYLIAAYLSLTIAALLFILFGLVLDGFVAQWSLAAQRWLVLGTHVVPAILGALWAVLSLMREQHRIAAALALAVNVLFAGFFVLVLLIAG